MVSGRRYKDESEPAVRTGHTGSEYWPRHRVDRDARVDAGGRYDRSFGRIKSMDRIGSKRGYRVVFKVSRLDVE